MVPKSAQFVSNSPLLVSSSMGRLYTGLVYLESVKQLLDFLADGNYLITWRSHGNVWLLNGAGEPVRTLFDLEG